MEQICRVNKPMGSMVSPYSGCSIHFLCSRLLSMLCQPLRSSYSLIRKNLLLPSQAILRLSLQATLLLLIFRRVLSKQKLAFSLKSRNRQLFLHRHPTLALLQHRSICNRPLKVSISTPCLYHPSNSATTSMTKPFCAFQMVTTFPPMK